MFAPPEGDEPSEAEAPPDEESGPLPSDVRFRWLSQGFLIVGVACTLYGAAWACAAWETIRRYPATTEARPVGMVRGIYITGPATRFAYVVDGKTYDLLSDSEGAPDRVLVHYDPQHPESHIAGSLTPPWMILALALGIGAFLSFVGYQFR